MLTITERLKDESELYRRIVETYINNLRVAAPGIIRSFDAGKQTASVQVAIREKVSISGNIKWVEIPILVDVPVFFPRAGGYMLTIPVQPGDECLVVFADCCIDAWWQSGGVQNQVDKRRHDLSDGFALVGITSQPRRVRNYSSNTIQLRNESGSDYVEINGSTVNVQAGTVNLNAGSVNLNGGSVKIGSNVTIDGRAFLGHTHSGVSKGSGTTGGVV